MTEDATPMRADARRNREQLIAAARDLFLEQGADAPLDEIARRAGVGIATLYRRFPDRRTLVREVLLDNLGRTLAALDRAIDAHPDAWSALVAFLHDAAERRITILVPVLAPSIRDELHGKGEVWSLRTEAFERFDRLVGAAQQEGRLRDDIGPGDLMLWIVKWCRPIPGIPAELDDLETRRHLGVLIDGLRAASAHPPSLPGAPLHDAPMPQEDGQEPPRPPATAPR